MINIHNFNQHYFSVKTHQRYFSQETEGVAYWVDLTFDNQRFYLDIHVKSRVDAKMKDAHSSEWDFDTPDLRNPSGLHVFYLDFMTLSRLVSMAGIS